MPATPKQKTAPQPPQVSFPADIGSRVPDWDTVMKLSWRPAWSIRSRRGTLTLLLDCWRNRRSGTAPQPRR